MAGVAAFYWNPLFFLIVVSAICRQADTRWQDDKRDGQRETERQREEGEEGEWTPVIYINMY